MANLRAVLQDQEPRRLVDEDPDQHSKPKEGKQRNVRGLRKNTDGPEIGDLTQEARGTATHEGKPTNT